MTERPSEQKKLMVSGGIDSAGSELLTLHAGIAPSAWFIDDIPTAVKGVSRGDQVELQASKGRFEISSVLSRSGFATFHVRLSMDFPQVMEGTEIVLTVMRDLGCSIRREKDRIGIEAPPCCDWEIVEATLMSARDEGAWTYSIGYLPESKGISGAVRDNQPGAPRWWWLSFSDSRSKSASFLGVAIVEGTDVENAARRAWCLGINPGGEVSGLELASDEVPAPELRERLLSRKELDAEGLI